MNTVSMKVNVPKSREIMGNKKAEKPVNYEQELDNVMLANPAADIPAFCAEGAGANCG